mgnify:CR=1 FL=1
MKGVVMSLNLTQKLDFLGLTYLRDEFNNLIEDAVKKKMPIQDFFTSIIDTEVAQKMQRVTDRRIAQARFPQKKYIDNFDWNHPTKIDVDLVRYLFSLKFLEGDYKKNVAFIGLCGLGKTHLMLALALEACRNGYSVIFDTAANIVNRLSAAQAEGDIMKALRYYSKPDILAIDEIGYLPIDKRGANLLFQVFSSRYEKGSIMLTTNKAFKDWGDIFNDSTTASAVLDRILHHCEVVMIEGKSYRMAHRTSK